MVLEEGGVSYERGGPGVWGRPVPEGVCSVHSESVLFGVRMGVEWRLGEWVSTTASLKRKRPPLGPYSRLMPMVLRRS